ncbi:MAG: SGNH/GDSL hydrolase family protein [Adhaeribacter sp.]
MKRISQLWVIAACLLLSLPGRAQAISPKTHTVLFLGNSITYAGQYINDLEAWYASRHPGHHLEFINLGLPSETVSGLSEPGHADGKFPRPALQERLGRVLAQVKPDLVFACYGMNDGIYLPFGEERFRKYREGMTWLHDTLAKTGARVILVTPPVYDEQRGTAKGYGRVLDKYSEWLLQQRKKGWEVADVHFPMKQYLEAGQKKGAASGSGSIPLAADGIHPGELGHWLIARQLLLHLGEKQAGSYPDIRAAMAPIHRGEELLKLVAERQSLMKDAWLTSTGHQRPGMRTGLPLSEAREQAAQIATEIQEVITSKQDGLRGNKIK